MKTAKPKRYSEIAKEKLPSIIETQFGKDAKLLSWKSSHITKKDEHFLGEVKDITCEVLTDGKKCKVFYVAKLNPRRSLELFKNVTQSVFIKEGRYFSEVVPLLNAVLKNASYSSLRVPECVYISYDPNEEVILLKDLRQESYKMFDKMTPMDLDHLLLVVKELAKQHSASFVYKIQNGIKCLTNTFPYMVDEFLHEQNEKVSQYTEYCKMRMASCILALEELHEYPEALTFLKKNEHSFEEFVFLMNTYDYKFEVMCHGDCWTNNMLFRYDETGKPESVVLLDFQQVKAGSIVVDIHYLLCSATNADVRRDHCDKILLHYYKTFSSICKKSGIPVPFTFPEMKQEFMGKGLLGFYKGIISIPLILRSEKDNNFTDFNKMKYESGRNYIEEEQSSFLNLMSSNAALKERLLDLMKTSIEWKLFNVD